MASLLSQADPLPPSLHSALFAPDKDRSIRTGVETTVLAALELLKP